MPTERPKKYLKFWKQCVTHGHIMPTAGLCSSLGWTKDLALFMPTGVKDYEFWAGSDLYNFNELRETIVLFLAAMNGEI